MSIISSATNQSPDASVKQEFRALIQRRRQKAKHRQQSMLVRLSEEISN